MPRGSHFTPASVPWGIIHHVPAIAAIPSKRCMVPQRTSVNKKKTREDRHNRAAGILELLIAGRIVHRGKPLRATENVLDVDI
jgi:hypothetical protein